MTLISRRSMFKAGAAGAAALAAPQIMTRAAFAAAHGAVEAAPFSRFKLGAFEVTVLSDGTRPVEKPETIFGTNQEPATVAGLLTDNFLPTDKALFQFSPVAVNTGSDIILFDTGNGEGGREGGVGRTRATLEASGISPDAVTVVVLTHMHGDHINGITEAGSPAYPNARYVTAQAEYDFWSSADRVGTPAEGGHKGVVEKIVPLAEKFTFIGDGGEVVSGINGMAAFGHTPGHMIYNIESEGRRLVLTADTANHFVLSLQRPDWEVRFDADKAAAAATRKSVFGMLAADRVPFIGYHMPFPSVGYIEAMGEGFRFVPETYQFDL